MDSFFIKPSSKKRPAEDNRPGKKLNGASSFGKKPQGNDSRQRSFGKGKPNGFPASQRSSQPGKKPNGRRALAEQEEIESESDDEAFNDNVIVPDDHHAESEEETEQEKRLRLTKEYIRQLENQTDDVDKRLQDDVLEAAGRLRKNVAESFSGYDSNATKIFRGHSGHKLSVTCVSSDGKLVYSGGKEGTITKWDIASSNATKKITRDEKGEKGHSGAILAMSLSTDGKFLATAGDDKSIRIWLCSTMDLHHIFRGHREAVTGVAFRTNTYQLFSCAMDRNVKVWNAEEKSYVETLYGHQDAVLGIDSFFKERCITAGGHDFSVRVWKILEESQLVFQLQFGSVECISILDEEHFVTGSDDGSVLLWGIHKKKPLWTMRKAHQKPNGEQCWVTSVDAVKNSDMFATGSNSGEIIVWKVQEGYRSISVHFKIPCKGFVNSLKFAEGGSRLIAGIGQEHRLGRWWREKESKNSVVVFTLTKGLTNGSAVQNGVVSEDESAE